MPTYSYQWIFLGLQATWALFVFIFGACVGSLVNVLVYRMPRGLGVVTPPSRCPACETRLTWRENIPILGWILLRGRCRFCRSPISARYPIVEAFVAVLFVSLFVLWYLVPPDAVQVHWHSFRWSALRPDWYLNPPRVTWPQFVLVLVLLGSLVAITLMDAETFTIDLRLTWFPAAAAVLVHTLHAAWVSVALPAGRPAWPAPYTGWTWAIATPPPTHWWWVGATLGAVVGLGVSWWLLRAGLIRRSFADLEEWERSQAPSPPSPSPSGPPSIPFPDDGGPVGGEAADEAARQSTGGPDLWTQYPHARREMFKEVVYLSPPITLAMAGGALARWLAAPATGLSVAPQPLWLNVLAGVLMGYLIGGGTVWVVRIAGSVAFRKEALGMGDVHLMAAVGACLGWIDAVLAFFLAAFVGLAWTVLGLAIGGRARRHLPYGPHLAVATLLVLLLKPLIEWGLNRLLHVPADDWPINLP
jgi:leader peptidase (prepilin peptidase)/N-methyltransferase